MAYFQLLILKYSVLVIIATLVKFYHIYFIKIKSKIKDKIKINSYFWFMQNCISKSIMLYFYLVVFKFNIIAETHIFYIL